MNHSRIIIFIQSLKHARRFECKASPRVYALHIQRLWASSPVSAKVRRRMASSSDVWREKKVIQKNFFLQKKSTWTKILMEFL